MLVLYIVINIFKYFGYLLVNPCSRARPHPHPHPRPHPRPRPRPRPHPHYYNETTALAGLRRGGRLTGCQAYRLSN